MKVDKTPMFFLHPDGPALIVQYLEPGVLQTFRCVNTATHTATTAEIRAKSVSKAREKYQKLCITHLPSCDKDVFRLYSSLGKHSFFISQAKHSKNHLIHANAPLWLHKGSECFEGGVVDAYGKKPTHPPAHGNHLIRLAENVRFIRVFYDGKAFRGPKTLSDVSTVTIDTEMDFRLSSELATYMVKFEFVSPAIKQAARTLYSRT